MTTQKTKYSAIFLIVHRGRYWLTDVVHGRTRYIGMNEPTESDVIGFRNNCFDPDCPCKNQNGAIIMAQQNETIEQLNRCQELLDDVDAITDLVECDNNADLAIEIASMTEHIERAMRCVRYAKRLAEANPCDCPCHCGGFDGEGTCKQPCDECDCVE